MVPSCQRFDLAEDTGPEFDDRLERRMDRTGLQSFAQFGDKRSDIRPTP